MFYSRHYTSALEIWPAGTRLVVSNRVLTNYQQEADSWSSPYLYFLANDFTTGPSHQDPRKETVYVPLVREQEEKQREVWIDIMALKKTPGTDSRDSRFSVTSDIIVMPLDLPEECQYVGVQVPEPPPSGPH